ncbi:M56 family metallopeptidase [Cognaticolwellia mytili]|uniref:M56 family metallopeptidase n=1 Tax=Cognaticolwellia mytili TaxID=1888913 RepID=UPI001301AB35|nr:TonB family protein [Cognaticolwellia mytili]
MIELIFEVVLNTIIPLTIVLSFILLFRPLLLKYCGANITYVTWLSVPLALAIYQLLPTVFFSNAINNTSSNIDRVLVTSAQTLSQVNGINWLMTFSLGITLTLIFCLIIKHWQFNRALSASTLTNTKLLDNTINSDIEPWLEQRRLTLVISEQVESPMLTGLIKPLLLLPSNFSTIYNKEQQELIVAHEICHFDRNDIYWNLIAFLFITLFWFHPLVWLGYIKLRRDQELSCDQTTLARKQLDSRINYSRALLITAQQKQRFAFAHLSFNEYGDKKVMLERITQIKNSKVFGKPTLTLYGLLIAALMTSVSYAGHVGQQGQGGDSANKHLKTVNTVYPVMRIEPKYPIQAAKDGVEGAVLLKFDVDSHGMTNNIRVVAAEPENIFNKVAIDALEKWQYGSKNNMAKSGLVVQLDFRMEKNSDKVFHLIERIEVSK